MQVNNLNNQAESDRDDLAILVNDFGGARRLGLAFFAVRGDELPEIFTRKAFSHAQDDGGALHHFDLGVQILGRANFVIHHALHLHDNRVTAKDLHARRRLIDRSLAEGENQCGRKDQQKHHDDIPNAFAENQQIILKATLHGRLAVAS